MDLAGESRALYAGVRSASAAERTAAFEDLGQRLYKALWPHVQSDPRLHHLAADSAQDALVAIWQQIDAGRGPDQAESFIGWALRIATNKLVDELRRLEPSPRVHRSKRVALSQQTRLDTAETPEGQPLADRIADPAAPDVEAELIYAEIHAVLGEIHHIQAVSDNSRTVLLKGFLEGWEDEDLAEQLGTSARNIHVIRCRDLAKLRQDAGFMARLRVHFGAA
jgi:RNA polymerase sigma factor (sigma-70 family)